MTTLTATESQELAQCEAVIRAGIQHFIDVGNALLRISDGRLYRQTHSTFKEYIEQTYKMSVRKAYQLCEQVEVINELKEADLVCANVAQSHAAELAKAPKGQRAEVLKKAQALAGDSKLTAAHIADVVSPRNVIISTPATGMKTYVGEIDTTDLEQAEEKRELIVDAAKKEAARVAFRGVLTPPQLFKQNLNTICEEYLAGVKEIPEARAFITEMDVMKRKGIAKQKHLEAQKLSQPV